MRRFLPVAPTRHADGTYMSGRPDDALYDAIAAGGAVMGRSPRMPGFGGSLTPEEIRGLVGYLRVLCRCEGPDWSKEQGAGSREP
jgi:mono/diheme cytochrome c family protein